MEIERKFKVDSERAREVKRLAVCQKNIEQYYTLVGDIEERYRFYGLNYYHTIKKSTESDLVREEVENECTAEEYNLNKKHKIGDVISKKRYIFPMSDYNCELDEYQGNLKGLYVCEIEFATEQEAEILDLPWFCKEDITFDKRYKNQSLATEGLPSIERKL